MLIIFDKACKKYGTETALENVAFRVEQGEFVFIVGPSGSGKTTILRLLLHETLVTSGKITIDDRDLSKIPGEQIPILRRDIGVVFQDFKILMDRTVGENIAITLEITGKEPANIVSKVKEVLQLVSLSAKKDFFPIQLSAGELQRVAIARAIIGGPKVLLADEPTGNLDPTISWEILKILTEINKFGTTIIMATHNVDIVNSMKKRVISLKNGKVIKDEKKGKYK